MKDGRLSSGVSLRKMSTSFGLPSEERGTGSPNPTYLKQDIKDYEVEVC
jgi:hypothetical protein